MFRELPIASSLRCCKGLSMGDIRGFHIRDIQEHRVFIYLYFNLLYSSPMSGKSTWIFRTTFAITAAFEVVI